MAFAKQIHYKLFCTPMISNSKGKLSLQMSGNKIVWYMDVVEAILPYRNATKTFLPIFDLGRIFHTSRY
jgi:hypothetical protein